jgi:hypothetical protein
VVTRRPFTPGYPDRVPTPRPAQSPQEPPPGGYRLPTPAEVCRALLRRHAARALARSSTALRATADALTHTRWRLEDTTRNRAVGLSVVPGGYAQGRADLALTHVQPGHEGEHPLHVCRCDSWQLPPDLRARPHACLCALPEDEGSHLPPGGPPFVTASPWKDTR